VTAPSRTAEEVLADFAADMDGLAAMVPPGIGQSIRGAVATLRTDLEHAPG
jgi:hypothetical protein